MSEKEDTLAFLLRLNLEWAEQEAEGRVTTPPGLPDGVPNRTELIRADYIQPPG